MRELISFTKELFIQLQAYDHTISLYDYKEILLRVFEFNGTQPFVRTTLVDCIMDGVQRHLKRVTWAQMKVTISSVLGDLEMFPDIESGLMVGESTLL